ncbi:uncharacterized protein [Eurosta solidaginis]|uniref:uncharacterized protein n=1 Tax=Eurosta solidaginis TaxID=178769 RepID=UPI003530DE61
MANKVFVGSIEFYVLGEDFSLYARRLKHLLSLNNVFENSAKISFLVSLGGPDLYKVLVNLIAPKTETDATIKFDDLIENLSKHFMPKKNVIAECFKFFKRSQRTGEPLQEYVVELKQIAQHCEFGTFQDKALLIQFVCGISEEKIQNRLLNDTELTTFEKAVGIATAMEMTTKSLVAMKQGDGHVHALNGGRTSSRDQKRRTSNSSRVNSNDKREKTDKNIGSQREEERRERRRVRCFRCGAIGHIQRYCRQPRKSNVNNLEADNESESSDAEENSEYDCRYLNNCKTVENIRPHKVKLNISGKTIEFEVDTGASETVINFCT